MSPLINAYSRQQEHQADIYALEVTHGIVPNARRAAVESFQTLSEINLSDPNPPPFIRFWLYSHPPLDERLVFARSYDPWSEGKEPRCIRWFAAPSEQQTKLSTTTGKRTDSSEKFLSK